MVYTYHSRSLDTPWDEPTQRSREYSRYLTGEAFNDAPWNRMGQNTLCRSHHSPRLKFLLMHGPHFMEALLCGLLAVDPSQRLTLADVCQHPWCLRYEASIYF